MDQSATKLRAAGLSNFSTHLSDGTRLPFDTGTLDAIFLVTVFGEIEAQAALLEEARRVLKPGGILSITEHHPDPDFESAEQVEAAACAHGVVTLQKLGWRWAFTVNLSATE